MFNLQRISHKVKNFPNSGPQMHRIYFMDLPAIVVGEFRDKI